MQHLRTCSDDEDFAVVGGASESSADTDELIGGHVDWTMAADSDDEMERYGTVVRSAAAASEPSARPIPGAPPPTASSLDQQDWMFDIRIPPAGSTAGTPAAAVNPAAAAVNPAAATANPAVLPGSGVQHPYQQSQQAAEGLAGSTVAGGCAPSSQSQQLPQESWQQRQQAAPQYRQQQSAPQYQRQQQQQLAPQYRQQQQQQQQVGPHYQQQLSPQYRHQQQQQRQEPALPGDLDARLDRLLLGFASGSGASSPPLPHPLAPAPQRPIEHQLHDRWGTEEGDRFLGHQGGVGMTVERVAHVAGGGGGVRFTNTLPPPQENFRLEYSDAPALAWLRGRGGSCGAIGAGVAAREAAAAARRASATGAGPSRADGGSATADGGGSETLQEGQQQQQGGGGSGQTDSRQGLTRGDGVRAAVPVDPGDPFCFRRQPAGRGAPGAAQQQSRSRDAPRARHPGMG